MLTAIFRKPYRNLLAGLTKKTIAKHKPHIIAVMGDGQTSIAREIVYHLLKQKYPVRRNLESPEAEFSVPLTILGYSKYPKGILEWLAILIKNYFNLKRLPPYEHFLILELNFVDPDLLSFWLTLLKPELGLIVGSVPLDYSEYHIKKIVKISGIPEEDILGSFKIALKQIGRYYNFSREEIEHAVSTFSLPQAKIRYFPAKNGATIIDATHYYLPIKITSVLELLDQENKEERAIIFTDNKEDLKELKSTNFLLNPLGYKPHADDTIIIRGLRNKKLKELEYLFTTTRPIF